MTDDQKTLDLYPIDYPFETLFSRMSAADPKLILNPDFQRKYKWDKEGWERASKFIESCLMRIPLPSCYFAEDDSGRHVVIDGVQRLTTILRFFHDEFALEGTTTFKELEGKKFSELGQYKAELEGSTIRCIVLRKSNSKSIIREIFSRLNQGAVKLSDQEIRHALFPGSFDTLLGELAEKREIKEFGLGPSSQNLKDGREAEDGGKVENCYHCETCFLTCSPAQVVCCNCKRVLAGRVFKLAAEKDRADKAEAEVARLTEKERMVDAAISVLSLSNTEKTLAENHLPRENPYWTVAQDDVARAIRREMWQRDRADKAEQRVRELEAAGKTEGGR